MNEFDMQSLRKKIKREPIEVNIKTYKMTSIKYNSIYVIIIMLLICL